MHKQIAVVLALVLASSTFAACGGGGYRARDDSKPGLHRVNYENSSSSSIQTDRTRYEQPQNVSYVRSPRSIGSWNPQGFDSVSKNLNLSTQQYNDAMIARDEIQRTHDSLLSKQQKAQEKADSSGKDKDVRKAQQANDELASFDANSQFERRLERILSQRQMEQYRASSSNNVPQKTEKNEQSR